VTRVAERGGVLGPYLESVKQWRNVDVRQHQNQAPETTGSAAGRSGADSGDARLKLLGILAEEHELGLQQLQEASGLAFSEFGAALAALEQAGLLAIEGTPGKESARLTEAGSALASFQAS
jgi:hypothetical protein